jgi:hypothetical protein
LYKGVKTEIYNSSSFFVVTGHVFQAGGLTEFRDLQTICDGLHSGTPRFSDAVTEETEVTEAIAYDSSASSVIFPKSCMPTRTGMRHGCIFKLARYLKNEYPLLEAQQLKPVFTIWWSKVLPVISTKEFGESWIDFLIAWDNVKHPLGKSMTRIASGLPDHLITNEASIFGEMGANLFELCIRLDENQRANWNNEPFPLACRIAGDVLGINRNYANSLLSLLTKNGFLVLVTKGNTVKANRYRLNPTFRR